MIANASRSPFARRLLTIAALMAIACVDTNLADHDAPRSIGTIYWSDGDSGRIDGTPFRLSNVDAPETGGVGIRGGARCEAERVLGYESKAFMVDLTTDAELQVVTVHGGDRYDRLVVDIHGNGTDIARQAMTA